MGRKSDVEALKAMHELLALSQNGPEKNKTVSMRLDPELKQVIDEVVKLRRMQTGDDVRFSEVARELLHAGLERSLKELEEKIGKEGDTP